MVQINIIWIPEFYFKKKSNLIEHIKLSSKKATPFWKEQSAGLQEGVAELECHGLVTSE